MTDYISREAAIEEAKKSHLYFDIKPILQRVPAADVRPVVRGKWTMTTERFVPERVCSSCECRFPVLAGEGITEVLNYCPNCGARMDGDGDA